MNHKIITGIASFGMSGRVFHAPLLTNHAGFHLKTIVERSKNEASALYPNIDIVREFDALLQDDEIELVVVNTPDHTHYDMAFSGYSSRKTCDCRKTIHADTRTSICINRSCQTERSHVECVPKQKMGWRLSDGSTSYQ